MAGLENGHNASSLSNLNGMNSSPGRFTRRNSPFDRKLGGPQSLLDVVFENREFLPMPGIEFLNVQSVTSTCTD